MEPLGLEDRRYLAAAEGWLGLGNWREAKAELGCISPPMREHPVVLCMRWNIHAAAKQWELAADVARKRSQLVPNLPLGWLELAHALHALKRTQEARGVLLPVVDRFPRQYFMRYKLACYACQLGKLDEARHWLEAALEMADSTELVRTALEDPELKPFWSQATGLKARQ
jgi:predicted Zn-dependent protease